MQPARREQEGSDREARGKATLRLPPVVSAPGAASASPGSGLCDVTCSTRLPLLCSLATWPQAANGPTLCRVPHYQLVGLEETTCTTEGTHASSPPVATRRGPPEGCTGTFPRAFRDGTGLGELPEAEGGQVSMRSWEEILALKCGWALGQVAQRGGGLTRPGGVQWADPGHTQGTHQSYSVPALCPWTGQRK